ncbi:MAG: hypothetical protein U0W65_00025 [Bacteroidia bacterium]
MLLENKGLTIDNFFVPPFTVDKGEILTIYMFGGAHFFALEKKLADIFTGKVNNDNVKIYGPFHFIKNTESFSDKPNIIFDLVGQYIPWAHETFDKVKQHVDNGGSAIFLDNHNDDTLFRTKHVVIEKLK